MFDSSSIAAAGIKIDAAPAQAKKILTKEERSKFE